MRPHTLALLLVSAAPAVPAAAQTMQAPTSGGMTALQVGIEPMMRVPTATYVAEADAFDAWIVAASRLALARSHAPAVLTFARRAGPAHAAARARRGGTATFDGDLAKALDALRQAPPNRFDALFARMQTIVHRRAWALHSGYVVDGGDARLRRSAAVAVMLEEAHLRALPLRPMPY